jgi:hypothetical protein
MKTSYKYLAIAFATILCSCNEEVTPDIIESQVQISANITPCVLTRVNDEGTAFTNGDQIKVQNVDRETKNLATYTYSNDVWTTYDELYWGVQSENTFNACYPATAAYNSFTIPANQTTAVNLASADWMTATTTASRNSTVALSFSHNLAKVTVTIKEWNNEYLENEKVISSLKLNSLSSVMTNGTTISGDGKPQWVKTNVKQASTSFVAIVAPGNYSSAAEIMQVYVNGSSTPLAVKTKEALTLEASKAYSFKLTVGKDLATITSSVTVGDWGDVDLDNQNATQQ